MLLNELYNDVISLDVLKKFLQKNVSNEMIDFLVDKTNSIIKIRRSSENKTIELRNFIKVLVISSNVQTATLISTAVYLDKLRAIIPSNVCGIDSTRHRMFLGCLILAAKSLNDSSPLNKHWTSYTRGLLTLKEINTIERELLSYFKWDINITSSEIIDSIKPLLIPIKDEIKEQTSCSTTFFTPSPLSSTKENMVPLDGYKTPEQFQHSFTTSPLSMTSPSSVASTYCESVSPSSHRTIRHEYPYMSDNSSTPNLAESPDRNSNLEKSNNQYDLNCYHNTVSNSLIDLASINDDLEKMAPKAADIKNKRSRWSLIF
ncbi:PHO85 cyclin-9 [Nakaseomyces bracarensis]|uniref:PHO85 cyclin-9 n=1 Tax=Nakaseomyces bracarensis TaxID=273131 RepID=A0ABR4NWB5_9SACH